MKTTVHGLADDDDEDYGDVDDACLHARPLVLIEQDAEIIKSKIANALRLYEATESEKQ